MFECMLNKKVKMVDGHRHIHIQTDTHIETFASPATFALFALAEETALNGTTAAI